MDNIEQTKQQSLCFVADIDLNVENRRTAQGLAQKLGIELFSTNTDELDQITKTDNTGARPRMILLQVQQANETGLSIIRCLRNKHPDTTLVLVSPDSLQQYVEHCMRIGIDDRVADPISAEELDAVFTRWLTLDDMQDNAIQDRLDAEISHERDWSMNEKDVLARVHTTFIAHNAGIVTIITSLLKAGDWDQLAFVLHRFRGACLILGYDNLAVVLSEMQQLLKAPIPIEQFDTLITQLHTHAALIDVSLLHHQTNGQDDEL